MKRLTSPPRPRLRRLSDEEIELWLKVAESVERREGSRLPDRLPLPETAAPAAFAEPIAPAASPPPVKRPAPPPLAPLERRLKQKLSRGRIAADAAIDLHGLRQGEAQAALRSFLHRAQAGGARIVIVVTGKGRTIAREGRAGEGRAGEGRAGEGNAGDGEMGVLRRAVPLWLAMPDFRLVVLGFEEASGRHGGAGALYVRLRRAPQH